MYNNALEQGRKKRVAYLFNPVDSQALLTNGVPVKSISYAD